MGTGGGRDKEDTSRWVDQQANVTVEGGPFSKFGKIEAAFGEQYV